MKDHLKNPNLYYILVPVLALIWVVFVSTISLGKANDNWKRQRADWDTSQKLIVEIIKLDPERLNYQAKKGESEEFDYSVALDEVAKLCKMSSANYSLSGGQAMNRGGKKTKTTTVNIRIIDIAQLAKFISQMENRWPNLECDLLTINKLKTGKNQWKASIKFSYTFDS